MEVIKETLQNDSCCPDLSFKTRAIGFGICLILAIIFSFMSCFYIAGVFVGSINSFVVFYSLGTFFSIASSFFFKGPKSQWQTITHAKRLIPSIIFAVAFIMTFVSVYIIESKILTIVSVGVQMAAGLFYLLTFIPYGTDMFKKCCRSIFCCEKEDDSRENML